jgi:hypothetical protein
MKRLDSTYWTDGKDIFYQIGKEWIKVTGEDSTVDTEDSSKQNIVELSSVIVLFPIGRR